MAIFYYIEFYIAYCFYMELQHDQKIIRMEEEKIKNHMEKINNEVIKSFLLKREKLNKIKLNKEEDLKDKLKIKVTRKKKLSSKLYHIYQTHIKILKKDVKLQLYNKALK